MVETLTRPREPAIIQTAATQTAEPKIQLTPEQIFLNLNPDNVFLSVPGGKLQAAIMFQKVLNDPENGISDRRRIEIRSYIETLVKESGIDVSVMSLEEAELRFNNIVAARAEDVDVPLKGALALQFNNMGWRLKRTLRNLVRKIVAPPKKAIEKVNQLRRTKLQAQS